MRVLLDEQLPRRFARELRGHDVHTVQGQRWAGVSNGELLRRAVADGFAAFVTADRNNEYQQNLTGFALGVIVLSAPSIAIEDLQPLVPDLLSALAVIEPGQLVRVDA